MKLYRFITDAHLGTPIALTSKEPLLSINSNEIADLNLYYLGDNIDLKRCKKEMYLHYLEMYNTVKKNFLGRMVTGNHELTMYKLYQVIDGDIMITHGDFVMWGEEKSLAFRRMKPAQGYGLASKFVQIFRSGKVSDADIKKLAEFAKEHGCRAIVCGHVHPSVRVDKEVLGVRVIVLRRGLSEVRI